MPLGPDATSHDRHRPASRRHRPRPHTPSPTREPQLTIRLRNQGLIHRSRDCLSKVSEIDQDAVRGDFWEVFDIDETFAPGLEAVGEARRRARQFEATWGKSYPAAVATVTDGLDELVAHLYYPRAHWPRIRHTNLIERTFGETRRRVKVIGRLPGERSALSLLFAVLERAAGGWRGITYTPADVRLLQMIRRDLGLTTTRKEDPQPDPTAMSQTSPNILTRNPAQCRCYTSRGTPPVRLSYGRVTHVRRLGV